MSDMEKKTPAAESGSTNKKPARRYYGRKPRQAQRPKAAKPAAKAEAQPEQGEKPARAPKQPKMAARAARQPAARAQRTPAAVKAKVSAEKKLPAQRTPRPQRASRPAPHEKGAELHIYPLGGLGEVGKNITLYECRGDMLLVDSGSIFPDEDMYGIDLVIPDFTFVKQNREKIKGVIITHGHEDHIGSLPYLLRQCPMPVYATRLTIGLIKNKLDEHGLLASTKLIEIRSNEKFRLG